MFFGLKNIGSGENFCVLSLSLYSCTLTPTLGLEQLSPWGSATVWCCSWGSATDLLSQPILPTYPPPACAPFFTLRTLDLELCSAQFGCFRGEGRKGWQWIGNDLCRPAPSPTSPGPSPPALGAFLGLSSRPLEVSDKICPWQKINEVLSLSTI